jgi:hypothetical protein
VGGCHLIRAAHSPHARPPTPAPPIRLTATAATPAHRACASVSPAGPAPPRSPGYGHNPGGQADGLAVDHIGGRVRSAEIRH